jgi:hypothetical protein
MFCSEKCLEEAEEKYHKVECPITSRLYAMSLDAEDLHENGIDIVVRLISTMGLENLEPYLKYAKIKPEGQKLSPETMRTKGFNANNMYDPTDLNTIFNLVHHIDKLDADICLDQAMIALQIAKCCNLSDHPDFYAYAGLCLQLMLAVRYNTLGIDTLYFSLQSDDFYNESQTFASQLSPFTALYSHNCFANTFVTHFGKNFVARASLPVSKGSILSAIYCINPLVDTFEERQLTLRMMFQFKCQCEACTNNWPLHRSIPYKCISDPVVAKLVAKFIDDEDEGLKPVLTLVKNTECHATLVQAINDLVKERIDILTTLFKKGEFLDNDFIYLKELTTIMLRSQGNIFIENH